MGIKVGGIWGSRLKRYGDRGRRDAVIEVGGLVHIMRSHTCLACWLTGLS